ncbi:hypothetical protein [Staphylococcus pettenkoferi]|uniref:hypothetical protein n=1 Tax=Staphylococcus pettenkoferi TaxID=170573 RepID=UPI002554FFE8|nr:hypothetical protein [Staphylococcus pettenkoferi]MDK7114561.1 hypothetical protein [Staphylococcus pettenkoferi]
MRKILALALAGIFVLGACGGNSDNKSSSQSDSNKKDEKTHKKESDKQEHTNNNRTKGSSSKQNTKSNKITIEEAKNIVNKEAKNSAPSDLNYNGQKSNNNKIYIDYMASGAVERIPMQAIVDAYSGELLDKYVNETEEHKAIRAQHHLNTPIIINKLQDPLIEEYQPEAYNKIKNYAQSHPNAFSKEDGQANQKLVNKILGNQEEPNKAQNNSEDPNEKQTNNDQTTEENHDKENKNEQPNSNKDDQEDSQQEHSDQNEAQQNDSTHDANSNENEDN